MKVMVLRTMLGIATTVMTAMTLAMVLVLTIAT